MFEQLSKIEHSSVELAKARSLLERIVEDYSNDPDVEENFMNLMYILLDMISNASRETMEGFEQLHKILIEINTVSVTGGSAQ